MKFRNKLADVGACALIAFLLGLSVSLTMLSALNVPMNPWAVGGLCAAAVCLLSLMRLNRWTMLGGVCCLGGGLFLLFMRNGAALSSLKESLQALGRVLLTGEGSLTDHAAFLTVSVTLFSAFISLLFSRMSGGVYPALLLFLFVLMGCWFLEEQLWPLQLLPGLIALALLYARSYKEGPASLRAISLAVAAALIAVLLVPAGRITWAPLENAAEKVQRLFYEYFLFTDPRAVYSVASDGYQPLGETLGGPANPREEPVMQVETDQTLLLRGSIKRTYTGYSWVDNSINSRYLLLDPTRQSKMTRIFHVDKVDAWIEALELDQVQVEMLSSGTSTLFVSGLLKSLSVPLDLATYFNDSGEVFIARSVEAGDHYSFIAYQPTREISELGELFAAAEGNDSNYASICAEYMNLPTLLEDEVYYLTLSVIENADTPLEKALAIQQYLTTHFGYSTEVSYPPQDRDFVSYFLLSEKQGYCTYFASAMAVMARLAGLPSRYVEGYLVQANPSGSTTVYGSDAHAWVEIYFEGIGWISFDPTPGSAANPMQPTDPDNSSHSISPQDTPTPEPTAEPTPDNTPTPNPGTPEQSEPTPTPTPEPENQPTNPPEPNQDSRRDLTWLWVTLLILLILAALVFAVYLRMRNTSPAHIAAGLEDSSLRLMVWYRAILTVLAVENIEPQGGESPVVFADRLVQGGDAPEAFLALSRAVAIASYSGQSPAEQVFMQADLAYHALTGQMKWTNRLRWLIHRMLHGIGNYRQIP